MSCLSCGVRFAIGFAATILACVPTQAQLVIVNETFDSYADQAAFEAVWTPNAGGSLDGVLIPNPVIPLAIENPPGLQGRAVNILSRLNIYNGAPFNLLPTATQSIRLRADIFDDGTDSTPRDTVGLRNSGGTNIIELGLWNDNIFDPYDPINTPPAEPTLVPGSAASYAYRVINFPDPPIVEGGLVRNPSWQYFSLDPVLDRPDDGDQLVNRYDIGAGWHRWTVTIGVDSVTFEFDLFRDGLYNPYNVAGIGIPGSDASVTYEISASQSAPFNRLQIGGPSGITSLKEVVIDNILLELIDVAPPTVPGDFDGDGDVDGADFVAWQTNFPKAGGATLAMGDADGDGDVDGADFVVWQTNFPTTPAPGAAPVPEPAAFFLAALGAGISLVRWRRSGPSNLKLTGRWIHKNSA